MSPSDHRVAYVCKMYPRFSETFIVTEVLAREAAGEDLRIVSLRPPADGRFHASLAQVRAPVHYLSVATPKPRALWQALSVVASRPEGAELFAELVREDVRDVAQALELAELIEADGITHLHAHFGSVATTVARLAARLTGVTYSFTAHAKDIFHDEVDPQDLARKLADADHVVTVSDHNVGFLRERFGAAAGRVERVYNGLDLEAFAFDPDLDARSVDIVAVGRLVEKKGFEVLVEACRIARDRRTPVTCRIVGTGEREAALEDLIAAHGLGDLVELTGALPQDRVRDEVRAAKALAAPCVVGSDGNADGLPTVILEAMALGTPVVATPVTGIPEAVVEGTTGRLVPEQDPVALADALVALLGDPAERRRLATAGRELVEQRFSSRRQAAELRGLLPVRDHDVAVA